MAHLLLLLACFAAANANVIVLDDRSYDDETKNGIWLVEFYAPWCGHCKHLAPIYDEAALRLADKPINLAKIDATANPVLTARYDIKGYPRLVYKVDDSEPVIYKGRRTVDGFEDFARRMLNPAVATVRSLDEMKSLHELNEVFFMLGFDDGDKTQKSLFDGFSAVAKDKRAYFTMGASSSAAVVDSFKAPATPFIAKVQPDEPPKFFSIPADSELQEMLGAWVERERYPLLTRLYEMNFKDFSTQHGKMVVIAAVDPEEQTQMERTLQLMRKFARPGGSPLTEEAREVFAFGWLDGARWDKFLSQYNITPDMLPHVFVYDANNAQFFQDDTVAATESAAFLNSIAAGDIMAQQEGVLGLPSRLLWQARHYPQPLVYGAFASVVLFALGLLVMFFKLLCADDDDDDGEGGSVRPKAD